MHDNWSTSGGIVDHIFEAGRAKIYSAYMACASFEFGVGSLFLLRPHIEPSSTAPRTIFYSFSFSQRPHTRNQAVLLNVVTPCRTLSALSTCVPKKL